MKTTQTEDGVIVEVFVRPKARSFRIVVEGDEVVVFCEEEPVKGRVNREIVKEFSKRLRRKVELLSGLTSKRKRLLIRDAEKSEVERVLLGQTG
ncbi:DUF167 family protein [Candidatus Bathyarchaeota archaeon]|nr:DUF167 family protein [Candidatus Bathyarchaeota archaeon]